MSAPISSPASSWRKWEAFSISRGGVGADQRSRTRSPTLNGSTGSESAQSTSVGRSSSRSASATRLPSAAPAASGEVGRISGKARAPAFDSPRRDTARRRRRSPRRPGRSCERAPHQHRRSARPRSADEVAEGRPGVAHPLVAGEGPGLHDHDPRDAVRVLDRSRSPIGPPQSWTTAVASRRSSSSSSAAISSTWRS